MLSQTWIADTCLAYLLTGSSMATKKLVCKYSDRKDVYSVSGKWRGEGVFLIICIVSQDSTSFEMSMM